MNLNGNYSLNLRYERVATEYLKHESTLCSGSHSKKMMQETKKAYKEMAKTLNLKDADAVKREIHNMKLYVNKVLRRCVRWCLLNSIDGQDALNYGPPWFKLLEKRLKLVEQANNMEMMQSIKYFTGAKWVGYITSKIVRCACRAAARELRKDHTNEGIGQLQEDTSNGGASKRDSTDGEDDTGGTSKLVIDSSVGGVSGSTSGGDSGNTRWGVSDFFKDDAPSALRATMILVSEDAVREFAELVKMEVMRLHAIWIRVYSQSIHTLMCQIAVGDRAPEKYAPRDWLAVDAGLLYDTRLSIVVDETFQSTLTLNPLILLYKLVVAAHERIDELSTLTNSTLNEDQNADGAQCGTQDNLNVPSCSVDVKENILSEMKVDGDKTNEITRVMDFYGGERAKHLWAVVHNNYISRGRCASVVLLQRRWYDMLRRTKRLLVGKRTRVAPSPILLALAKRFPSILTEKLPPWSDLVRDYLIYQDSDLKKYKMAHGHVQLQVPEEVGENLVFNDIYDWSDDEVEVIDVKREIITVPDSDDEQTDKGTDDQIKMEDNMDESTDANITTKTETNNDDSLKKLESIDLSKAKVKIVFEDDSDDEINNFINGANKPNTSVNSNTDVILNDVQKNNTNQSVLNSDRKMLKKLKKKKPTKSTVLLDAVIDEVIKSWANDTISNEIEAEPCNKNLNLDIDEEKRSLLDSFVKDTSNEVIKEVTKEVTKAVTKEVTKAVTNEVAKAVTNEVAKAVTNEAISTEIIHQDDISLKVDTIESPIPDDERSNTGDETSSHKETERPESQSFDEKLFKLPLVVLTPIECLPEWRKHSKNNIINCRQFGVKHFARKVLVTAKQANRCRPYVKRKSKNGMSFQKNQELGRIPKNIRTKLNILSKRLNLSRTCFSRGFWSVKNMELLELCRPCSVQLKRIPRVVKKIELPDIDEIRRMNKSILTAQVAPITVSANRILVIDSTARPSTPERIQNRSIHSSTDEECPLSEVSETQKTKPPSTLTVKQDEEIVTEEENTTKDVPVAEENVAEKVAVEKEDKAKLEKDDTAELLPEGKRIEHVETEKVPTESDIKAMIKAIVRKGDLPKAQETPPVNAHTGDLNYFYRQKKELEKDLRELSRRLILHLDETASEPVDELGNSASKVKKREKKKATSPEREKEKLDSLEEWKRQKKQNLIYFNLNLDVDKKSKKKNKSKTDNSNNKDNINEVNTEGSLGKISEATRSTEVPNVTDSTKNNDMASKRKTVIVSDETTERQPKHPKIENNEDGNAPIFVIEDSNDGNDAFIKIEKNTSSSNEEVLKKFLINVKPMENSTQIKEPDDNIKVTSETNTEYTAVQRNVSRDGCDIKQDNDNASCVVKKTDNNAITQETNITINTVTKSVSMYYMVNLQNNISGSNTTLISPLPETPCPMPVIQSVTSLSQLPPQSLNKMYPSGIGLNQACQSQISPIYLNQTPLNQIRYPIDTSQPILNQPNLNRPILNQPILNQPIAIQNQIPHQNQIPEYSSQVLTVSTENTFESLVKRPSCNKILNTNPTPSRTTQMPLIQSVSSLRETDQ